jgi:hypothetical protein
MALLKLDIEIDGETYSLNKVPDEKSGVVKAETSKLLGAVDLKTLVDDLGRVGSFIRIAYNGVGAAGPRFTENQIEIQRLGYDVTKLCDKSALTVAKFKKASSSILTDLQCTYEYLLDNLEEMALETLSAVSKLAGDMEKAALELHTEFVAEEVKVEKTLEKTQKARGAEAIRIEEMKKERQKMELQKKEQERLMNEQQRAEREAEARRRDLEQREDEAIAELTSSGPGKILKKLCNALTSMIGVEVFDTEAPEKQVQALKENRKEAHEAEKSIRQQRHDTLSKMTEFACKIKDCDTEEEMSKIAEDALHQAIGALKQLSAVMIRAAAFWKQMQDHCRSLADSEMTNQVEKAMKYPDEKRLKVWTSSGFKIKAIEFYAGWVALNSVCTMYVEYIKLTQKELYRYIAENPTYEESRQNVKELAARFLSDLQNDQKALADQEFEAQKAITALGESEDA